MPRSTALEFSMAQLLALLAAKFNWDPYAGPGGRKPVQGFDENAWDREEVDYEPVVVDVDSEEEVMDTDVNFAERRHGGRMDMHTGKMVFGQRE
jgi:hypothetical protein